MSVVYHGNGQSLQFDLHVAAGADPAAVNLVYGGVQSMSVDGQGRVLLHTAGGDVLQEPPTLYQDVGGTRRLVAGHYVERGNGQIGFAVDGAYDPTKELVLDPTLAFSTYLGGSGNDYGNAIAVDLLGNSYLVGTTASTNFPTQNGYQSSLSGMQDAFLAKLNPQGTALVYATYLAVPRQRRFGTGHCRR